MCKLKSEAAYGVKLRIGTSGWHYKHWKGLFYPTRLPASKMLEWYASQLDTVEINNTFTGFRIRRRWRYGGKPYAHPFCSQ